MLLTINMKIIIGIICALAVQHAQCEGTDIEPRIAGGTAVRENLYELAVLNEDGEICTATLIDSVWALTSATCALRVGFKNSSRSSSIRISYELTPKDFNAAEKVKDYYVHPAFKKDTLLNDIALIELQKPAPATSRQRLIPSATDTFTSGSVYGYGSSAAYELSSAKTTIMDTVRCQKYVPMNANRICTLRSLACEGDQGGPLVSDNKVIGIISIDEVQEIVCDRSNQFRPVVTYTRVAPYKSWIKTVTKLNYL